LLSGFPVFCFGFTMTVYDIIILVVMGIFSLWGLWRGIIREAFEAAGLIIGLLAARQFAPGLGAHIPPRAVPQLVRTIAVSIIILLAVYLVVKFVGMLVRKIVRHGPVKSMDRLGGFIIGAVKGALLILALAVIAAFMPFGGKLDSVAGDSPLFGTTMKVAGSLAHRYKKALGTGVRKQTARAVAAVMKKTGDDRKLKRAAEGVATAVKPVTAGMSGSAGEITGISIQLDRLSPEADRLVKEILKDKNYLGLSAGLMYDKLKASGTVVDIDLSELDSDARRAALLLLENPALTDVDLDKLSSETGVDLHRLAEQFKSQARK